MFLANNPWASLHAEALSDWVQEGQGLEEPALAQLSNEMAYEYVQAYLDSRFVYLPQRTKYAFSYYSGRLKAVEFLLQSNCPESVKHAYLNFMLPTELRLHHISPEVAILEPYIRQGFKEPVLIHYYDSMLNRHHRFDRGNPAPDFTLRDHNGKLVKLSDLRGKKVVIDCWATWCSGCVANMPIYDSIAHASKDPNILFLSASIDDIDSADVSVAWRNFITKRHLDPAVHLNGPQREMAAFREAYGITGVPRYFIIDKDSKIVSLHCIHPLDPEFLWDLKN
jgi:peroxiredoxin